MKQLPASPARSLSGSFFSALDIPDERLANRLNVAVSSIELNPSKSFPTIFNKKADLEGFYRLVNNDRVESSAIIEAACAATVHTSSQESLILAIHDTSLFPFPNEANIEGIGRLTKGKKGFFGHFCIGATLDREIVGLLGFKSWIRKQELRGNKNPRKRKADKTTESHRWIDLMLEVHQRFSGNKNVVHVTDREGDDYTAFSKLIDNDMRFVIRAKHDRNIKDSVYSKLFDSIEEAAVVCEREVALSARKQSKYAKERKTHPARKGRIAKLGISAKTIEVCRSGHANLKLPKTLKLNFIRVFEINPPEGEAPVEWVLITGEPIGSAEDLLKIVDIYRGRWTIEEFFKCLKTGCDFEDRGFESLHALLNCLAIFIPIACKLYNLKAFGRVQPDRSSKTVVSPIQIKILMHLTKYSEKQLESVGPVMWAIASIGGHIKANGLPGWQVLARGYEKLLQLEQGWIVANQFSSHQISRSDM